MMSSVTHGRWTGLGAGICAAVGACALRVDGADVAATRGRLAVGFEASGSLAPADDAGFNDTSYGQNALRMFRLSVVASLRLNDRVSVLADVRTDGFQSLYAQGLYIRLRPWRLREIDIQAGRIPPVFGAWARRRYASDNPVIGYPLVYQYLVSMPGGGTPIRPDAPYPYPRPDGTYAAPLPVVALSPWDTGVEVRLGHRLVEISASLTQGTLSRPRFQDDNDGKQLASRLALHVTPRLEAGASFARGEWPAERSEAPGAAADPDRKQTAWGLDAELSAGRTVVRAELIYNTWDVVPEAAGQALPPARVLAAFGEAIWRLAPRLRLGGRIDRMTFRARDDVPSYGQFRSWEEPLTRAEIAVSFLPHRRVLLKAAYQYNWQDGAPPGRRGFAALQAVVRH
jgi:hypothetical protein